MPNPGELKRKAEEQQGKKREVKTAKYDHYYSENEFRGKMVRFISREMTKFKSLQEIKSSIEKNADVLGLNTFGVILNTLSVKIKSSKINEQDKSLIQNFVEYVLKFSSELLKKHKDGTKIINNPVFDGISCLIMGLGGMVEGKIITSWEVRIQTLIEDLLAVYMQNYKRPEVNSKKKSHNSLYPYNLVRGLYLISESGVLSALSSVAHENLYNAILGVFELPHQMDIIRTTTKNLIHLVEKKLIVDFSPTFENYIHEVVAITAKKELSPKICRRTIKHIDVLWQNNLLKKMTEDQQRNFENLIHRMESSEDYVSITAVFNVLGNLCQRLEENSNYDQLEKEEKKLLIKKFSPKTQEVLEKWITTCEKYGDAQACACAIYHLSVIIHRNLMSPLSKQGQMNLYNLLLKMVGKFESSIHYAQVMAGIGLFAQENALNEISEIILKVWHDLLKDFAKFDMEERDFSMLVQGVGKFLNSDLYASFKIKKDNSVEKLAECLPKMMAKKLNDKAIGMLSYALPKIARYTQNQRSVMDLFESIMEDLVEIKFNEKVVAEYFRFNDHLVKNLHGRINSAITNFNERKISYGILIENIKKEIKNLNLVSFDLNAFLECIIVVKKYTIYSYANLFMCAGGLFESRKVSDISDLSKLVLKKILKQGSLAKIKTSSYGDIILSFGKLVRNKFFKDLFVSEIDKIQAIIELFKNELRLFNENPTALKSDSNNNNKSRMTFQSNVEKFFRGVVKLSEAQVFNKRSGFRLNNVMSLLLPVFGNSDVFFGKALSEVIFILGSAYNFGVLTPEPNQKIGFIATAIDKFELKQEDEESIDFFFRGISYLAKYDLFSLNEIRRNKIYEMVRKIDYESNDIGIITNIVQGITNFSIAKNFAEISEDLIARIENFICKWGERDAVIQKEGCEDEFDYSINISRFFFSLGMMADNEKITYLDTNAQKILRALFDRFIQMSPDNSAISKLINGLGRMAEAGLLNNFGEIDKQLMEDLFDRFVKINPEADAVNSYLMGLGKLASAKLIASFTSRDANNFSALIVCMRDASAAMKSLFLYAVGELAEKEILENLSRADEANIKFLVEALSKFSSEEIEEGMLEETSEEGNFGRLFYGMMKMLDQDLLQDFDESYSSLLQNCLANYVKTTSNPLEMSVLIYSLARMVLLDKMRNINANYIQELLQFFYKKMDSIITSEKINLAMCGLGELARKEVIHYSSDIVYAITNKFQKYGITPNNFSTIAFIIRSINEYFKKNGYSKISHEDLILVNNYINKLAHSNYTIKNLVIFTESVSSSLQMAVDIASGLKQSNINYDALVNKSFIKAFKIILKHQSTYKLNYRAAGRYLQASCKLIAMNALSYKDIAVPFNSIFLSYSKMNPEENSLNEVIPFLRNLSREDRNSLFSDSKRRQAFKSLLHFILVAKKAKNPALLAEINYFNSQLAGENLAEVPLPATRIPAADTAEKKALSHSVPRHDANVVVTKKLRDVFVINKSQNVRLYNVRNNSDLADLCKKLDIVYTPNKEQEVEVIISPIWAIHNHFGVLAGKNFPMVAHRGIVHRTYLGMYMGIRQSVREDCDLHYGFEVPSKDGQLVVINAKKKRNFTAFVNHSEINNCEVENCIHNGQPNIKFYLNQSVKQFQQVFISYGDNYFNNLEDPIPQVYMDKTDNWKSPDDIYLENMSEYSDEIECLDFSLAEGLGFGHVSTFLITRIFKAVLTGKLEEVQARLALGDDVDRPSYALEVDPHSPGKYKTRGCDYQENITPLMLACYLGHIEIVKLLVDKGADYNRRGLHSGRSAIFFTLLGKPSANKIKIIRFLFDQNVYISLPDAKNFNLLQHAIRMNEPEVVKYLFRNKETAKEMIAFMVDNDIEDVFLNCIMNGNKELLTLLFTFAAPKYFVNKIIEKVLPIEKIIVEMPLHRLAILFEKFTLLNNFYANLEVNASIFSALMDRCRISNSMPHDQKEELYKVVSQFFENATTFCKKKKDLAQISEMKKTYMAIKKEMSTPLSNQKKGTAGGASVEEENTSEVITIARKGKKKMVVDDEPDTNPFQFFPQGKSLNDKNEQESRWQKASVLIEDFLKLHQLSIEKVYSTTNVTKNYEIRIKVKPEHQRAVSAILNVYGFEEENIALWKVDNILHPKANTPEDNSEMPYLSDLFARYDKKYELKDHEFVISKFNEQAITAKMNGLNSLRASAKL